tara:strand:- start:228 stop:746 length:519 start_codon:yes stop_codon:yes gene_type:complete
MVTIISASNRKENLTYSYSVYCKKFLEHLNFEHRLFSLAEIPDLLSLKSVYEYETSDFNVLAKDIFVPAKKLLFIVPEYNGSMPGILKLFIDAIHPQYFKGKKAALIGVSSGRAGNLRGMDHLTDILHHLQVNVMPQKLPISKMNSFLEGNEINNLETKKLIEQHINRLIEF